MATPIRRSLQQPTKLRFPPRLPPSPMVRPLALPELVPTPPASPRFAPRRAAPPHPWRASAESDGPTPWESPRDARTADPLRRSGSLPLCRSANRPEMHGVRWRSRTAPGQTKRYRWPARSPRRAPVPGTCSAKFLPPPRHPCTNPRPETSFVEPGVRLARRQSAAPARSPQFLRNRPCEPGCSQA